MKKLTGFLCVMALFFGLLGTANAALTTIGTATYDPDGLGGADPIGEFNLIWEDNNNGNSVVWLDYSHAQDNWDNQMAWAAGLDSALTIDLYDGYSVDWGTNSWRLPTTVDGPWA